MQSLSRPKLQLNLLVALLLSIANGACGTDEPDRFPSLMNLAKAHLENGDSEKAIEALTEALELNPESIPALRNLARAYLRVGQPETAFEYLEKTRMSEPDSAATSYLSGITLVRRSEFEAAIAYFEQAARLDPHTAAIRFQLARAYKTTGQGEKAIEQLEQTVRLDPLHGSAQFELAMYARRANDKEEYRRQYLEFERLRKLFGDRTRTPLQLEACKYTTAEPAVSKKAAAPDQKINVRFTDATDQVFVDATERSAAAFAVIDMNKQGRYVFFVADPSGALSLMTLSPAGQIERKTLELKLDDAQDLQSCIIGNFHNDVTREPEEGLVVHRFEDVCLIGDGGGYLLKRTGPDTFEDVTQSAGLAGLTGRRARWVDYEYDGDLDLVIARETGLELWQNNGNGAFTNVTGDVGIPDTPNCVDVAAADLDGNGGVDFVVARGTGPTLVFENQRGGRFAPMSAPPGPWPVARHLLVNDLNNDGHPDVIIVGEKEAAIMLGRTANRVRIDLDDFKIMAGKLIDYDNDGWLDFCAVGHRRTSPGEGRIRLWRNGGDAEWLEVTAKLSLDTMTLPPLRGLSAADLDTDGDTDLMLHTADSQLRFLRNDGGHVNGQLKLRLLSFVTASGAIGTRVELREDEFRVTRLVHQDWPIEIGLNGRKSLNSVQTVWTNGAVDNKIDVIVTDEPLAVVIIERPVDLGSCPYLYAWDGDGFRFVTDMLGSGALGLALSRQAVWFPDPHEIVAIGDSDLFRASKGAYVLKITSELRETTYLDYVKLLAVDHPRGVEIHSTDKFMLPPFTPSEMWALGAPLPLVRAEGDDGIDRTAPLKRIDGVFAPPGRPLPPPLKGACQLLALTLDFGPLDTGIPLVLALTGWLRYGDASSNIALSQDHSAQVTWPTLEVQMADGNWSQLDVAVGLPAGKTKTILCNLEGKLPEGAQRLRLTTTFEIRWDRIALFERRAGMILQVHESELRSADLAWRGFSQMRVVAPGHPKTPDYDHVSDWPPWRTTLEGWCTRYGDVRELVAETDGKLIVLNGGDALSLHWTADRLPALATDRVRSFFLYAVGWDKEENANTVGGEKVGPLPVNITSAHVEDLENDWRLRYNTRWVPRHRFDPIRYDDNVMHVAKVP